MAIAQSPGSRTSGGEDMPLQVRISCVRGLDRQEPLRLSAYLALPAVHALHGLNLHAGRKSGFYDRLGEIVGKLLVPTVVSTRIKVASIVLQDYRRLDREQKAAAGSLRRRLLNITEWLGFTLQLHPQAEPLRLDSALPSALRALHASSRGLPRASGVSRPAHALRQAARCRPSRPRLPCERRCG